MFRGRGRPAAARTQVSSTERQSTMRSAILRAVQKRCHHSPRFRLEPGSLRGDGHADLLVQPANVGRQGARRTPSPADLAAEDASVATQWVRALPADARALHGRKERDDRTAGHCRRLTEPQYVNHAEAGSTLDHRTHHPYQRPAALGGDRGGRSDWRGRPPSRRGNRHRDQHLEPDRRVQPPGRVFVPGCSAIRSAPTARST